MMHLPQDIVINRAVPPAWHGRMQRTPINVLAIHFRNERRMTSTNTRISRINLYEKLAQKLDLCNFLDSSNFMPGPATAGADTACFISTCAIDRNTLRVGEKFFVFYKKKIAFCIELIFIFPTILSFRGAVCLKFCPVQLKLQRSVCKKILPRGNISFVVL